MKNILVKTAILLLFIINTISANAQGNNTLLVDDFEDFGFKNKFNLYWQYYTDISNKGKSEINFLSENEGINKVMRVNYKLNKADCPFEHAYVVLGCPIKPETVDSTNFRAIAYDFKGDKHTFVYRISTVKDYAFHEKIINYSDDWTTVIIPFSELKQTWGNPVPFNKNLIETLQWQVSNYSNDTGYFHIDNVRLVKDIGKFKAELERTAPHYNFDTTFSAVAVREDIISFKNGLEEVHPNLYRYISKDTLDSLFNTTIQSINSPLTTNQAFLKIKPLMLAVKNGFEVAMPTKFVSELELNRLFPFDIKIFNNQLYVYKNYLSDTTIKKGDEIVSINNQPASEIIKNMIALCPNVGNITSSSKYYVETRFKLLFSILYGISNSYQIDFKTPMGGVLTKNISGEIADKITYYHKSKNKESDLVPYKLSIDKKKSIATLKISSFMDEDLYTDKYNFYLFLQESFKEINKKKVKNLILDLRNTEGGNGFNALELMKYLSVKDFYFLDSLRLKINKNPSFFNGRNPINIGSGLVKRPTGLYGYESMMKNWENKSPIAPYISHFTGKIFVLVNGESYAPTDMLSGVLKAQPKVMFIGDELMSERLGYCGYGAPCILQNTKIIAYIPIQQYYYSKSANEKYQKGRGLMPDYEMQEDLESFMKGKDNIMDFTIDLINQPAKNK